MAVEEEGDVDCTSKNIGQTTKLSHKKWRRLLKKEKRRVKRQQLAEQRRLLEEQDKWRLENDKLYRARQEAKEKAAEKKRLQEEEESKRQEKLWLEREAQAQIAFTKMREREEKKERERQEQERKIKEEWEEEQRLKKEKEERKKQEIQDKENAVFKELEKPAEKNATSDSQWHNPLAPPSSQSANYGTEQDNVNCSFYLKTGACRFGDRCSRVHPRLTSSVTLLIPHMYQDIRLSQTMLDEADHDTSLEFDDEETYERYKDFFEDVLPEFEKAGKVVQFKVCCNNEPHLRGNVYVQFTSESECAQAFAAFNGRWYAGRQLSCEYSPVTKWRSAICGFFTRNRCPRGKNCNFLHVYRNPGNAFRNMDRDESPGRTPYSICGSERSTRDWRYESVDRESNIGDRSSRERREHRRERSYSRKRDYHYDFDYRERSQDRKKRGDSRSERSHSRRERSHDRSERSQHRKFDKDDDYNDNRDRKKGKHKHGDKSPHRDHHDSSDNEHDLHNSRDKKQDYHGNHEKNHCDQSQKEYECSDGEHNDRSTDRRKRTSDNRNNTNNENNRHNVCCKHSGDCDCSFDKEGYENTRKHHNKLAYNSGKDCFGRDVDRKTDSDTKLVKDAINRSDSKDRQSEEVSYASEEDSSDESNNWTGSKRKISDNESLSSERSQNRKRKHKSHKHGKKSKKKHKHKKTKKSSCESD